MTCPDPKHHLQHRLLYLEDMRHKHCSRHVRPYCTVPVVFKKKIIVIERRNRFSDAYTYRITKCITHRCVITSTVQPSIRTRHACMILNSFVFSTDRTCAVCITIKRVLVIRIRRSRGTRKTIVRRSILVDPTVQILHRSVHNTLTLEKYVVFRLREQQNSGCTLCEKYGSVRETPNDFRFFLTAQGCCKHNCLEAHY